MGWWWSCARAVVTWSQFCIIKTSAWSMMRSSILERKSVSVLADSASVPVTRPSPSGLEMMMSEL